MAGSSILRILEASVICCGVTLVLRQTAFHLDWLSKVTVILQFCICVWQHLTSRPPVSHVDRPGADAGILCCILIPMAVLSDYNTFNQISSESLTWDGLCFLTNRNQTGSACKINNM
ncbi:hypothetical protein LOTGIDRAFT_157922 [Lottia gigantea]|uniref:Uncharacterized protein n=1 Tax=Lottia gigantea TaxID=225164 RepID=V4AZQ6_LOTGI|nr:hypothetical protein LOTGIDRAFT_157922 [Lottia gigantea]ESP00641.1 hypothetical protein LOTGIDRAFT_157922 [Lottia gigantea]